MERAYTTAHPGMDKKADLVAGIRWVRERAAPGQSVSLWCQQVDTLPDQFAAAAQQFGVSVVAERPRPRGTGMPSGFAGPVVIVDVPPKRVLQVEPLAHPMFRVGVVVAEHLENDLLGQQSFDQPWIDAFTPVCLAGPEISPTDPLLEDPVVSAAMRTFTVRTRDGRSMLSHEHGVVTSGLMLLRDHGHTLVPDRLLSAALQAGWPGRSALAFRDVAAEIAGGSRKRPKWKLTDEDYERWRQNADQADV